MRRNGIVERVAEGVWAVPRDLLQKANQHDEQKTAGIVIELRSHLPVEQLVSAIGATWLDRALLVREGKVQLATRGFGVRVREAMAQRVDFLISQRLAERKGQRVIFAPHLLVSLRDRELASVGQTLQQRTGKTWSQVQDGQLATGVYRQSIQLISGRFAMLDDGLGFSLVPWRPLIDLRRGQHLSVVVHGTSENWELRPRSNLSR